MLMYLLFGCAYRGCYSVFNAILFAIFKTMRSRHRFKVQTSISLRGAAADTKLYKLINKAVTKITAFGRKGCFVAKE